MPPQGTTFRVDESRIQDCLSGPNAVILEIIRATPIKNPTDYRGWEGELITVPSRTCCTACGRPL